MEIYCDIEGFAIRGYKYHKDDWNVERAFRDNKQLQCKITERGVGVYLDDEILVGTMPTDLSNQGGQVNLTQYLGHSGQTEVVATLIANTPRILHKGPEIPCKYRLMAKNTPKMKEVLSNIKREVDKFKKQYQGVSCSKIQKLTRKQKSKDSGKPKRVSAYNIFVKEVNADTRKEYPDASPQEIMKIISEKWKTISSDVKQDYEGKAMKANEDVLKDSGNCTKASLSKKGKGPAKPKSSQQDSGNCTKASPSKKGKGPAKPKSSQQMKDGGKVVNGTATSPKASTSNAENMPDQNKSSKKRRSEDPVVTSPKQKKRKSISGIFKTDKLDEEIGLTEKGLSRIGQRLGSNWQLLGIELGFKKSQIDQCEEGNNSMKMKIHEMLNLWHQTGEATLYAFKTAAKNTPALSFDLEELKEIFEDIRKQHKEAKGKLDAIANALFTYDI